MARQEALAQDAAEKQTPVVERSFRLIQGLGDVATRHDYFDEHGSGIWTIGELNELCDGRNTLADIHPERANEIPPIAA